MFVNLKEFKEKDYENALREGFKQLDEFLLNEEGKAKLKEIQASCG